MEREEKGKGTRKGVGKEGARRGYWKLRNEHDNEWAKRGTGKEEEWEGGQSDRMSRRKEIKGQTLKIKRIKRQKDKGAEDKEDKEAVG